MFRVSRLALIACMTSALLFPIPALADQSAASVTLNPPPPSFESCKTVGQQTICRGTREFVETPVDTGIVCGTGAAAFDIYDQGVVHQTATRYYDAEGNLTRRVIHEIWTSSFWSNPLTGDTVPYTQNNIVTDILTIPGDLGSVTTTAVGSSMYTDPVTHQKVLRSAGRVVTATDGSVEFSAGPQAFLSSDPTTFDAVCAALAR